jgi:hypothetical protein
MSGSDDVLTIWRYMDLGKYVSLLSEGLFFCCPRELGDDWEGCWGGNDVLLFRQGHKLSTVDQVTSKWSQKCRAKSQLMQAVGD